MIRSTCLSGIQRARHYFQLLIILTLFLISKPCSGKKHEAGRPLIQISSSTSDGTITVENRSNANLKTSKLPVSVSSLNIRTGVQPPPSSSSTHSFDEVAKKKPRFIITYDKQDSKRNNEFGTSRPIVIRTPPPLDHNIEVLSSSLKRALWDEQKSRIGRTFKTSFQYSTTCTYFRPTSCHVTFTVSTSDRSIHLSAYRTIIKKALNNLSRKRGFNSFFTKVKVTVERTFEDPVFRDAINKSTHQSISNTFNIDFFVPRNIGVVWVKM